MIDDRYRVLYLMRCVVVHRFTWERVQFRMATTVHRCLHSMAPEYFSELCLPVKLRPSRYQLQSSQSNQLIVPPVKLSTYGPRSFAVAGPTTWNNLPEYLRDPELSIDNFRRQLKTFLFAQYWRWPLAQTLVPMRSINLLFKLHYLHLLVYCVHLLFKHWVFLFLCIFCSVHLVAWTK